MSDPFVTARFRRAVDRLLEIEGEKYTDDPNDKGGPTKWGISQRSYPDLDIGSLTRWDAELIYFSDYWSKVKGDGFDSERVALAVFLFAVNAGPATAIRALQVAMNGLGKPLSADGRIGPATLNAANGCDAERLHEAFTAQAERHYRDIVEKHPEQAQWLDGWLARLAA